MKKQVLILLALIGLTASVQGQIVLTVLASFDGTNGATPGTALALGNDGNFYGTTTEGGSFGTGTVFKMMLISPPLITSLLTNEMVAAGSNIVISVAVSGTAPFTYQWYFDGAALSEATNATLTLTDFSPADAGSYYVAVSNAAGGVVSQTFTLSGAPVLGISLSSHQPLLVWPASATNSVLQMTTNLAAGTWVKVSNGLPYSSPPNTGLLITNPPSNAFFRLQ